MTCEGGKVLRETRQPFDNWIAKHGQIISREKEQNRDKTSIFKGSSTTSLETFCNNYHTLKLETFQVKSSKLLVTFHERKTKILSFSSTGKCRDKFEKECQHFSSYSGYCDSWKRFMTRWCPYSCGFCKPDTPGNRKSPLLPFQQFAKNLLRTILSYLLVCKLHHALWTFLSGECFYLPNLQTHISRMCITNQCSLTWKFFLFFMTDCTHPKKTFFKTQWSWA